MDTLMEIDVSRIGIVAVLRGNYYISLKSGNVLRWANKVTGREYHTLTSSLWRKAGLAGDPNGSIKPKGPMATYYFHEEADAVAALSAFVESLIAKGVKI